MRSSSWLCGGALRKHHQSHWSRNRLDTLYHWAVTGFPYNLNNTQRRENISKLKWILFGDVLTTPVNVLWIIGSLGAQLSWIAHKSDAVFHALWHYTYLNRIKHWETANDKRNILTKCKGIWMRACVINHSLKAAESLGHWRRDWSSNLPTKNIF